MHFLLVNTSPCGINNFTCFTITLILVTMYTYVKVGGYIIRQHILSWVSLLLIYCFDAFYFIIIINLGHILSKLHLVEREWPTEICSQFRVVTKLYISKQNTTKIGMVYFFCTLYFFNELGLWTLKVGSALFLCTIHFLRSALFLCTINYFLYSELILYTIHFILYSALEYCIILFSMPYFFI